MIIVGQSIILLSNIAVVVHNRLGARFKNVYIISGLYILWSVFRICAYALKYPYLCMVSEPAFYLAQYLFAYRYHKAAYEMPYMLNGDLVPEGGITFFSKAGTKWTMAILNVTVPCFCNYVYSLWESTPQENKNDISKHLLVGWAVCTNVELVLILSSDILLLHAVFKIRSQMKDRED